MKWEDDGAWCGELTTRNTGECPNAVVVSRLSQILEETPHPKYNLTAKACQGILRRAERRGKDLPKLLKAVLIRQSQGASPQERTEAPAPTEAPTSYAVCIRGGCDGGGKGALVQTEKSGTLGTGNDQTIFAPTAYSFDSLSSNSMKSKNPHSGCREVDVAKTLDTTDPTPSKNQGGIAVVAPAAMAFDTTQITSKENGSQPEFGKPCHTLNANAHVPCVAMDMTHACDVIRECGEQVPALQARIGTGGNQAPLTYGIGNGQACEASIMAEEVSQTLNTMHDAQAVMTYQDVTGTLSPGAHAGSYNGQDAYNDMLVCGASPDVAHALRAKANCAYREDAETYICSAVDCRNGQESDVGGALQARTGHTLNANGVVRSNMVVRRLTPLECTRLQGYPDGWVDIGDWTDEKGKKHKDADSPKYKALGNSIALPFWDWMLRRMARYLPEGATLGSLFDGISGFNVCWARIHGAECCRWSSEIEQFPIAVTKKHFGDEKSGEKGDWDIFSGGTTW